MNSQDIQAHLNPPSAGHMQAHFSKEPASNKPRLDPQQTAAVVKDLVSKCKLVQEVNSRLSTICYSEDGLSSIANSILDCALSMERDAETDLNK